MCGIAGLISLSGAGSSPGAGIVRMCDLMHHRGPDGEGYLFSDKVSDRDFSSHIQMQRPSAYINEIEADRFLVLGHRRLSIIDLALEASQPMADVTGRYWLVFNGEIYNHRELRAELESKGYVFQTDHSDSEVILNGFSAWGRGVLKKLRGMFAFFIYDVKKDYALIARDRLGIKPLFFTVNNSTLRFSSEVKPLLSDKSVSRDLCKKSIYDYLSFRAVAAPKTIFKDVSQLPAAHFMEVNKGVLGKMERYWSGLESDIADKSEGQFAEEVLSSLSEASKCHLESDVDYGVFLSGGVDSSTCLEILSRHVSSPIKAYSIGFDSSIAGYSDEFEYSRMAAKHSGADYTELLLSREEFNNTLDEMLWFQDTPIADPANIPIYSIAKRARADGVKVLIGGEGCDELMGGYSSWSFFLKFHSSFEKTPSFLKSRFAKLAHSFYFIRNKRKIYRNWYDRNIGGQTVFWGTAEYRDESWKQGVVSEDFLGELEGYTSYEVIDGYYQEFLRSGRSEYLDWMSFLEINYGLPEMLLARVDRMTMAASVEGRVPFMDHKFVELCMSVPAAYKIRGGEAKSLFKKAARKVIPQEIVYRPKQGFPVPLSELLFTGAHLDLAKNKIYEFNGTQNIFNDQYLDGLFCRGDGKELWIVYNLASWYLSLEENLVSC
ncbi:MAG: asparagine synthase (glutamine-hydrolyzing) [Pseudomonadales bacterium]